MSGKLFFLLILIGLRYFPSEAQLPGSFDLTFGIQGKTILPIGAVSSFGRSVVIQDDGKSVVACIANNGTDTDFAIARFTTEGDADPSFDGDGMVMTDFDGKADIAEAIALDESNRILVAGSVDNGSGFEFGVARHLKDGTIDETFGDQGQVTKAIGATGFCKALAIQADGKIILGGYALSEFSQTNEFVLMRFETDGRSDTTFGENGVVVTNLGVGAAVANAILIQPDQKIILAGQVLNEGILRWEIAVARYNQDGTLDEMWDEDGITMTGIIKADFTIKAIAMQADNKIVVGGYFGTAPSNNQFAIARYHIDGRIDVTFGKEGIVFGSYGDQDNQINTIVVQPDQQILVAGTSLKGSRELFAIARLDSSGDFDPTFGNLGIVRPVIEQNDGIHSMALQQDGKLIIAGESFNGQRFSIAVARVETGLSTRTSEIEKNQINVSIFPNPVSESINLTYSLLQNTQVQIDLYDQAGQYVHIFEKASVQNAGQHEVEYNLPTNVTSGVYFLILTTDMSRAAQKLVVIK